MGDQTSFDLAPLLAECLLLSVHQIQSLNVRKGDQLAEYVRETTLNRALTILLDLLSALAESEKVAREAKTKTFEKIWALPCL